MRKRFRKWLVLPILAVVAIAAWFLLRPPDMRLEARAHRVASMQGWFRRLVPQYFWLSDHAVLAVGTMPRDGDVPTDPDDDLGPAGQSELFTYDIVTRRFTPLPEATHLFQQTRKGMDFLTVSPNGKKVFWWGGQDGVFSPLGVGPPGVCGMDLERRTPTRSPTGVGPKIWTYDSRRWMEFIDDGELIKYVVFRDADRPDHAERVRVPPGSAFSKREVGPFFGTFTSDDHVLVNDWFSPDIGLQPRSVMVFEFRFGKEVELVRQCRIAFPNGAGLNDLSFSPRGDRMAWVFNLNREPPMSWLPAPFRKILGLRTQAVVSIWMSGTDGKGMRELLYTPDVKSDDGEGVTTLRWLPDGKTLSFWFDKALWTVPTD